MKARCQLLYSLKKIAFIGTDLSAKNLKSLTTLWKLNMKKTNMYDTEFS